MQRVAHDVLLQALKKMIFDLVDEVRDAGDALIIRNRGQEDHLPCPRS